MSKRNGTVTVCSDCWEPYGSCGHKDAPSVTRGKGSVAVNHRDPLGRWVTTHLSFDFTAEELDKLLKKQ